MCGIAAILLKSGCLDFKVLKSMADLQRHRGPDDEGYLAVNPETLQVVQLCGPDSHPHLKGLYRSIEGFSGEGFRLGLAHRRLSIIDLSANAHQPMPNEDGRVWLVFNGEVYNYRELREKLLERGHRFKSDSDAEVLIHGYEEWGLEGLLSRIIGMWAFIIVDLRAKRMFMVRDRFGIKPLYYTAKGGLVACSSEIKPLLMFSGFKPNVKLVYHYLTFQRPQVREETFFTEVLQVLPAHYVEVDIDTLSLRKVRYWSLNFTLKVEGGGEEEYVEEWRRTFLDAVKLHLRTDVPLGFLLSGGIDSSSIVAASHKLINEGVVCEKGLGPKLLSFSSIVEDEEISEEEYVNVVVESFKLERYTIRPTSRELMAELERFIAVHEEPPEGPSVYAQWKVMELASKHVKAVLDGQGGDELLAGYHAYIPLYIKELVKRGKLGRALKEAYKLRDLIASKAKLGLAVALGKRVKLAEEIMSDEVRRARHVVEELRAEALNEALAKDLTGGRLLELLKYEDRNSMAYSIESRVPFLDHRLAELSMSMPEDMKIKDGWTKYVHRQALKGILPEPIRLRRSKIGFEVPEAKWLREVAREASQYLENAKEHLEGYLKLGDLKRLIEKFAEGRLGDEYARLLWRALFLACWLKVFSEYAQHSLIQNKLRSL